MRDFVFSANPARVRFGSGTLDELGAEIERLALERVIVLSTPAQRDIAAAVAGRIGAACVGTFTGAAMHTPVQVTDEAMLVIATLRVDGVVSVGGGSTIGLGKAIAFRTDLPQIVVPTTYAGSEMTPILGETSDGAKVTRSSPRILPEVVLYDVNLTLGLPVGMSVTSGFNAIAHAVEALYARDRNPIVRMMALDGIRALSIALPEIAADGGDVDARSTALYGAWLCGTCLGTVGMALHHKLCHVLGGTFDLPHAETHCAVLPHALAYNAPFVPDVVADLAAVFGNADPAHSLYDLAGVLGAPRALRDLGMPRAGIANAVERTLANPYWNPRPLDANALCATIERAWAGEAPNSP